MRPHVPRTIRKFISASARGQCAGIQGLARKDPVCHIEKFSITNARMATTTKNMVALVCLVLFGLTDFSESQGTESSV